MNQTAHDPAPASWAPAVPIFGIQVNDLDLDGATRVIIQAVARRSRGYVVTPNVHHIVLLQHDTVFRAAYDAAALRLPDGMPLVWASRMLGHPLRARVTGSDLLPSICREAAAQGSSVYFAGGRTGVAERAATRLAARYPGLRIAGTHAPPDRFAGDERAAEDMAAGIARARPDIVFVGLGAPAQERWIHRYWEGLGATVAICCGAAIDYAAGAAARAPTWMHAAGLEWLWRLGHDPRRLWRRYLVHDAAFCGIFLREWWRTRVRTRRG